MVTEKQAFNKLNIKRDILWGFLWRTWIYVLLLVAVYAAYVVVSGHLDDTAEKETLQENFSGLFFILYFGVIGASRIALSQTFKKNLGLSEAFADTLWKRFFHRAFIFSFWLMLIGLLIGSAVGLITGTIGQGALVGFVYSCKLVPFVSPVLAMNQVLDQDFEEYKDGKNQDPSRSGMDYVETSVTAILSSGSPNEELLRRSSPQLTQLIREKPQQFQIMFDELASLGSLISLNAVETNSMAFGNKPSEVKAVAYEVSACFENSERKFTTWITCTEFNQWQLVLFLVEPAQS